MLKKLPYLLLPVLAGVSTLAANEILRVVGSDLIADFLEPHLEAVADDTGHLLDVALEGTIIARTELKGKGIDLGFFAIPRNGEMPPEDAYETFQLGYLAVVVAVNKSNPVIDMTLDDLSAMYGSGVERVISSWGDLGLKGAWANRPISPISTTNDVALCQELFRYTVMGDSSLRTSVLRYSDPAQVLSGIIEDSSAIGVLPSGLNFKGVKVLSVAGSGEGFAFGPTAENIYYGDYPLALPFYIVVPKSGVAVAKPYIKRLLSDDAAKQMSRYHIMPLPQNIRQQIALKLELPQ